MNKRGVSAVVANVLIVLLVVASVAIIWAVVRPTIEQAGDEIGAEQFFIGLEIEDVELSPGENVKVIVKRRAGEGDITDLKIIVFDGTESETFSTNEELNELETKSYTLNYDGLVKKISIAPVFESASGEEKLGNVADELEYSNKEVMKNHGAVAWWRFEGSAEDEVGGNDGTLHGEVNCDVSGKYGKGCYFGGDVGGSDYIVIEDSSNFDVGEEGFTYSAWIKVESFETEASTQMFMGSNLPCFWIRNSHKLLDLSVRTTSQINATESMTPLESEKWYHVVGSFGNDGMVEIYLDGNLDGSAGPFTPGTEDGSNQFIGKWHATISDQFPFNGKIDEPMIFNRALTDREVKSLYNLDLG